jgi:hypothetical protein
MNGAGQLEWYLSRTRDVAAAKAFCRNSLKHGEPRSITLDAFKAVWPIDMLSSYPVQHGHGSQEAPAVGSALRDDGKREYDVPEVRRLTPDVAQMDVAV